MDFSFISDEEKQLFSRTFCNRHLVKSGDRPDENLQISEIIRPHVEKTKRDLLDFRQEALLICANEGDGITWTCEFLNKFMNKCYPHWNVFCFSARLNKGLPEITKYIGIKKFYSMLKKSGLLELMDLKISTSFSKSILLLSIILLNVILYMLVYILKGDLSFNFMGALNISSFYISIILTVLVAVLYPTISIFQKKMRLVKDTQLSEKIFEEIKKRRKFDEYNKLIEMVAYEYLTFSKPTCSISDDFYKLDYFTKDAILKVATLKTKPNLGTYLWIILESFESKGIMAKIKVDHFFNKLFFNGKFSEYFLVHLNYNDRKRICNLLDIPIEEESQYIIVKNLVRGTSEKAINRYRIIWKEFIQLNSNNEELDASDIFKLMAFNNQPPFIITENNYLSIFTEKKDSLFVQIILAPFTKNNYLQKAELKNFVGLIKSNLQLFLLSNENINMPFRIKNLSYRIVRDHKGIIPNYAVHLFWLIYWTRHAESNSYSILKKISYHAKDADIDAMLLGNERSRIIIKEFFIQIINIVVISLHKVQYFHAIIICNFILNNFSKLTTCFDIENRKLYVTKTINCLWQTYILTNDENFLIEFMNVLTKDLYTSEVNRSVSINEQFSKTAKIYFQLIGSKINDDNILALEQLASSDSKILNRIYDFMNLTISDYIYHFQIIMSEKQLSFCGLNNFIDISSKIQNEFNPEFYEKIEDNDRNSYSLLDFQIQKGFIKNLIRNGKYSIAIDQLISFVLKISMYTKKADLKKESQIDTNQLSLLERALILENIAECLSLILKTVSYNQKFQYLSAPSKYIYIKKLEGINPQMRQAINKILHESQFKSSKYNFPNNIQIKNDYDDFNEILELIFSIIGEKKSFEISPNKPIPTEIFELCQDLYSQSALVWEHFGLDHMRDRVLIERSQFVLYFSDINPNTPNSYYELLGTLSTALSSQGTNAIISHLTIFSFLSSISDISTFYLSELASRVIIKQHYSNEIKFVFCYKSLCNSMTASRLDILIADYLTNEILPKIKTDKTICYDNYFDIAQLFHAIFEIARLTNNEDLFSKIKNVCDKCLSANWSISENEYLNNELRTYIDYHLLERSLNKKENIENSEVDDILSVWESKKNHWLYGAVLDSICDRVIMTKKFLEITLNYLETSINHFSSTPMFSLVRNITNEIIKEGHEQYFDKCKQIIFEKAIPNLKSQRIENALDIYKQLSIIDKDNEINHLQAHSEWNLVKIERDKCERMGYLIEKGYFWGVFDNYFSALKIYKLPVTIDNDKFCDLFQSNNLQLSHISLRADDIGGKIVLIKTLNDIEYICFDFILLAKFIFGSGVDNGEVVTELRERINLYAKSQIKRFFRIVANTESVPLIIKEIIVAHEKEYNAII